MLASCLLIRGPVELLCLNFTVNLMLGLASCVILTRESVRVYIMLVGELLSSNIGVGERFVYQKMAICLLMFGSIYSLLLSTCQGVASCLPKVKGSELSTYQGR